MDFLGVSRDTIKSSALEKLASLAIKKVDRDETNLESCVPDTLKKLLARKNKKNTLETNGNSDLSSVPASQDEIDVLLALCKTTEFCQNSIQADILYDRFQLYFQETPRQLYAPSVHLKESLSPTPWTKVSFELVSALCRLSGNFPHLTSRVTELIEEYISKFKGDLTLMNLFSLVGVLQGLTNVPSILNATLISQLISVFTVDNFYDRVEDVLTSVNDPLEIRMINNFELFGFEFSSLFFMFLYESLIIKYLKISEEIGPDSTIIDYLIEKELDKEGTFSLPSTESSIDSKISEALISQTQGYINYTNNNLNKIVNSTKGRRITGYSIKSSGLQIVTFLSLNEANGDENTKYITDVIKDYLFQMGEVESSLDSNNIVEMINSDLLESIFKVSSLLSFKDKSIGYQLNKLFPNILSLPLLNINTVNELSKSLSITLQNLSEDEVVSSIYTLSNLLSDIATSALPATAASTTASAINDSESVYHDLRPIIMKNIISSILSIARNVNDDSVTILIVTLLNQKIRTGNQELNLLLLEGLNETVNFLEVREFLIVANTYLEISELYHDDSKFSKRLLNVWSSFSIKIAKFGTESEIFNIYLQNLLSYIVAQGDGNNDSDHHRSTSDVHLSANKIARVLKPLASLLPNVNEPSLKIQDKLSIQLFKDAWYNLCIHGYSHNSKLVENHFEYLQRIAHSSPALASEETWNRTEKSIELNTILRRPTSKEIEKLHKETLTSIVGSKLDAKVFDSQISKPQIIFLSATLLLEGLRVTCGDCSTCLIYFSDPSIATSHIENYMASIVFYINSKYANSLKVGGPHSYFPYAMAGQLKTLLALCCHRDFYLQDTAFQCCDLLISRVPSSLCHKTSGFALLDILSILFDSIIDADTNEYDPNTVFTATTSGIEISLSDSYEWRHKTLTQFSERATKWVTQSLMKCNSDMKAVLQSYVSSFESNPKIAKGIHYGVSFALEMAGKILPADKELCHLKSSSVARTNTIGSFLSQFTSRNSLNHVNISRFTEFDGTNDVNGYNAIRKKLNLLQSKLLKNEKVSVKELTNCLLDCGSYIINGKDNKAEFIEFLVRIPFINFKPEYIETAITVWYSVIRESIESGGLIIAEAMSCFEKTIVQKKGLYDTSIDIKDSKLNSMEYLPTSKSMIDHSAGIAASTIKSHSLLISFFSSHFEVVRHFSTHLFKMFTSVLLLALQRLPQASTHPFARLARFELVRFSLEVLRVHWSLQSPDILSLTDAILDGALSWFTIAPRTPYGNNKLKIKADYTLLSIVAKYFGTLTYSDKRLERKRYLLLLFLDHEISIITSWLNPLDPKDSQGQFIDGKLSEKLIVDAFDIDERLSFYLIDRYKATKYEKTLKSLIDSHPYKLINLPNAIKYVLDDHAKTTNIVLWAHASPIDAINLFLPPYTSNPLVLQYTMRSLESYDSHLTFFYVPQIVQALRHDSSLGYVRRYILETANVSQLFAHQIIWNMSANMYKDEESTIPDPIKPVLDEILATMVNEFSPEDRDYYEREFSFFQKVTGISGKLKPFIKKSKAEKKAKIDAEMAAIDVEEGVYLPSNPDGLVVDINRQSGRPLQSHAKAPFMATFKIQKEVNGHDEDGNEVKQVEISNLSAIFKVGDDCRQDVLALQLISVFRTIWMDAGLDVFVFPYRVTATAPGCGIIDVLPNSISRDMLGREAVNGLYEYFTNQFGPESSPQFQKARNNFVKSLAAYSIVTYILQIKDRHNGNIMYDSQGHILHIDFGFCFDIVPGGVKFEQSPFKLTHEMVRVMGHTPDAQAFKWFEELCIKAFLASRPYMSTIINCVAPMLDSGLPCFKPKTMKNLEARFVPNKTDKEAANYIRGLIRKSYESLSTKGYDEFQRLTNGIPY